MGQDGDIVTIRNMRNALLDTYVHTIEELVQSTLPKSEQKILKPFSRAIVVFNDALGQIGNFSVEELQKADEAADKAWIAIKKQLEVNCEHYEPSIRQAALEVQKVFSEIPDPTRLPYQEEYAQLEKLLERLSSLPTETLKMAMVDGWKSELRRRYTAFIELEEEISERKSSISIGAVKTSRLELYEAYRVLIQQIRALAILNPDDLHLSLASRIDDLIREHQTSALRLSHVISKSSKSGSLMSIDKGENSHLPGTDV